MPIISVRDLTKVYRIGDSRIYALNNVSLDVEEGEFVSIVGTSGSGKSTLLNMLAGLEQPSRGEIVVCGHHIEHYSENQLVRYRQEYIGFIFQSFNLLANMTALENVALPMTFLGVAPAVRKKRALRALEIVGLKSHMRHKPGEMSGGQQQRVAVARALVANPRIIFADEPTGNLDSRTSADILNLLQSLSRQQGRTVVMVTHDLDCARAADRSVHILDGQITHIDINNPQKQGQELA